MKEKEFRKSWKNSSNDEEKLELMSSLFHDWCLGFQSYSRRSPLEALGYIQKRKIEWKSYSNSLPPLSDGSEVTENAFGEFFNQFSAKIFDENRGDILEHEFLMEKIGCAIGPMEDFVII